MPSKIYESNSVNNFVEVNLRVFSETVSPGVTIHRLPSFTYRFPKFYPICILLQIPRLIKMG